MYLTIHSPDQYLFEGDVDKVTLPGSVGSFQVLKDHAPLVTTLKQGYIIYQVGTKTYNLPVNQGVVEVLNNKVTILVEADSV